MTDNNGPSGTLESVLYKQSFGISHQLLLTHNKSENIKRKNENNRIISVSQAQSNTNSHSFMEERTTECVINHDLFLKKRVYELNRVEYCALLLVKKMYKK